MKSVSLLVKSGRAPVGNQMCDRNGPPGPYVRLRDFLLVFHTSLHVLRGHIRVSDVTSPLIDRIVYDKAH